MSVGRHAVIVTAGNMIGQVCQLAALPFVARYADPASFGTYTLFVGACAIATVFAGMRYESAIVVAVSDRQSRLLSVLVLLLGLATALGTAALASLALWIFATKDFPLTSEVILVAAAYIGLNTVFRIATSWFTRMRWFGWVGIQQLVLSLGTVGTQVVLLLAGVRPDLALIHGVVGGQLLAVLLPLLRIGPRVHEWTAGMRWTGVWVAARKFVAFPRYMIAYGLNSTIRERMIQMLIGWGAGATALGSFAMAQRLVGAPHLFLHGGVGPALLGYARQATRAQTAKATCLFIECAALLLIPPFTFVAINSHSVVEQLFGERWAGLAPYLTILTLPFLLVSCSAFVDRLFELYGHQRSALAMEFSYSVCVLGLLALVGLSNSGLAMTSSFALLFSIYHIYYMHRTFVVNELPREHIPVLLGRVSAQLVVFTTINLALTGVSSLWLRAAALLLCMLVVGALYYFRLGGRGSVRTLFAAH